LRLSAAPEDERLVPNRTSLSMRGCVLGAVSASGSCCRPRTKSTSAAGAARAAGFAGAAALLVWSLGFFDGVNSLQYARFEQRNKLYLISKFRLTWNP